MTARSPEAVERKRINHNNRKRAFRSERNAFLSSIKNIPCMDCGKTYPPYVMDFDHVHGTKKSTVSRMAAYCSMQDLLEEISKCEIVCANCHRIRTFTREQHKK